MRPLFIPLRRCYYDAFLDGTKTAELRLCGRQWTERTCTVGRPAILSCGYSGERVEAVVVGFERRTMDTDIYGPQREIAVISLRLTGVPWRPVIRRRPSPAPTVDGAAEPR